MARLSERDLRSLERRSMYSIFAPLDDDKHLSQDLRQRDEALPIESGKLACWGFLRRRDRRRQGADDQWVPAMFMFVRRF